MISYIIRRVLYAIPILIGVNIFVFGVFFIVNSPDDMARLHLGSKRVTPEQVDKWKREHSLDLPYFYNAGWHRVSSFVASQNKNKIKFALSEKGNYRLRIETNQNKNFLGKRVLKLTNLNRKFLTFSGKLSEKKEISLPLNRIHLYMNL